MYQTEVGVGISKVRLYECDYCETKIELEGISKKDFNSQLEDLGWVQSVENKQPYHFCSRECLICGLG